MKAALATAPASPTDQATAPGPAPQDIEDVESAMDIAGRYATARPAQVESVPTAAADLPEVDLSGAPELKPVKKLRARQRMQLYKAMFSLQKRLGGREQSAEGEVDINLDDLDVIADMDELLEAMAVDPEAYAFWATEEFAADPEARISALFSQYAEQLGESEPSTT